MSWDPDVEERDDDWEHPKAGPWYLVTAWNSWDQIGGVALFFHVFGDIEGGRAPNYDSEHVWLTACVICRSGRVEDSDDLGICQVCLRALKAERVWRVRDDKAR